jgi:2-dehydropantoate 2-reductase
MDAVHVVGAGGIGCAVGYALRTAGLAVTFVEVNPRKLRGEVAVAGRPPVTTPFVPFTDWRPTPGALVLLCTKCYDNPAVLDRLPAEARLVPMQNGFDPDLDRHGHAAEGICSFVSECDPDRPVTRITRPGALHLGARGGSPPTWLPELARALGTARLFRVVEVADVRPFKHAKLLYNAAISPLAAAAGLDNGDLLHDPRARRLFFALLRENYAILTAAGKPLGQVGPFHPATVMRILNRPWLARGLAAAFYPSLRGTYCSMSGDLPRGRTEIANYNGRLVEWAGATPCPLNRRAVEVITRMQRERIAPHAAALRWFEM